MSIGRVAGTVLLVAGVLAAPARAIDLTGLMDSAKRVADAAKPMTDHPDEAAQEKLIGEQAKQQILARAPLAPLPAVQKYVNQVGRYVARKSERQDVDWRFYVIDDATVNSWAAPDGYVFITTGLLQDIASEAELAGILAHEIEHVVQRHHLKAIQKANERGALANLAGVAKDEAGVTTPTVNPQLDALRGSIGDLYARGLDRGDEFDADRRGVELAAQAGYDPYGLPLVLQKIGAHGKDDTSLAVFTRTHPSIDDRLRKLDKVIDKLDPKFFPGRTQEARYREFVRL